MAKFIVGIDLGTTNSVLAYASLAEEKPQVQLLPIPQLVGPATVENRLSLPSFLYLPPPAERTSGNFDLPWHKFSQTSAESSAPLAVVGEWARRLSAEAPQRTIAAAKSWLCHSRVDRRQAILPWGAPDEVQKLSPLAASTAYLAHLAAAWNQAFPEDALADQTVVLTVPASFDVAARQLTHEAAIAAGLPESLILLEEPQAAIYAWLASRGDTWRKSLALGNTLLVCDVGGGTTDLTLVGVAQEDGELVLRRIAVGDHLLVGGDNMDLALAHFAAGKFAEKGTKLDPWQSVSLWHSCRAAKEDLLRPDGPLTYPVAVLGRGSRLIGGTVTIDLERQAAADLLLTGFFPQCSVSDRPVKRRASGFQQLGLPFESDAAITKHLAAFLTAQGGGDNQAIAPSHVLFNGGVFKSPTFRTQLLSTLHSWAPDAPPQLLEGEQDLDYAVARGAAYYGWAKLRGGVRIRGGAARSYYVGIETSGLAIPGMPRPLKALCVVPQGMEEGTQVDIPSGEVGLVVGEPATFRFFSASARKQDRPGDSLDHWTEEELSETDSLEAHLPVADDAQPGDYVPVKFQASLTELGVLELWCQSTRSLDRWKLEFSVREDADQ